MAEAKAIRRAHNFQDLTGRRFGRYLVVEFSHAKRRTDQNGSRAYWKCLCDCGEVKSVESSVLKSGLANSCGCLKRELSKARFTTHGKRCTPEFDIWSAMRQRCSNPNDRFWQDYGGRGIGVCAEWQESFESFYKDMGPRPTPKHSLDRINNDLGYSPENCRWATGKQQVWNRRTSRMVTAFDQTLCLSEWASITGLSYGALKLRLNKGWSPEVAITTPLKATGTNAGHDDERVG